MNLTKTLEHDYEDRVACNCSLLDVFSVHEANGIAQDTIFMGTYDGHLYAMRIVVKEEGYPGP